MPAEIHLLEDLNPRQKEAVSIISGQILILAGPGSGKTKTLTHRLAFLLNRGITPENILAVTFTNKAAQEMRERIRKILPAKSDVLEKMFVGTFHSLCLKFLRQDASLVGFEKNFTIFDEDDSLSLLKEAMKELQINPKQFPAGLLANTISNLKNELITPEKYAAEYDLSDLFPKTISRVYQEYQKELSLANAMDFDDLLTKACQLLEKNPKVLIRYQEQFRFINVDEYQDVNQAQYILIKQLAGKHQNLAVVGDDAQAIYGFRGADFRNILNFEKDWPQAKIVVLDQNYRSSQTILDAATGLISHNSLQKQKELWTKNQTGALISLTVTENERIEAGLIKDQILNLLQDGYQPRDIALFYRTNAQSRVLEEALLQENLPYQIVGGVKFYQRKEVKDILAYLRFLLNPRDLVCLKRIINIPSRGIGKSALLQYLAMRNPEAQTIADKVKNPALLEFEKIIQELGKEVRELPISHFFKTLLNKISYQEYLDDLDQKSEERWYNVEELVNLAKKFDEFAPPTGAEKLLEEVALASDTDNLKAKGNCLKLMTLHASKGLEFPIVFLVGLEEGVLPHSKALFNSRDLEEERRLCYVGLTRAKEKVFLSLALRRLSFGSWQANPPSRFLTEIPENLMEVKEDNLGLIEY